MEIRGKKNKTSLLRGENVIWSKHREEYFFLGGGRRWGGVGLDGWGIQKQVDTVWKKKDIL